MILTFSLTLDGDRETLKWGEEILLSIDMDVKRQNPESWYAEVAAAIQAAELKALEAA